ncbi:hypothetical protein N311_10442, partial [Apaloderma vittatum]
NAPEKLWTTGQGDETQTSHSDLTPSPTTVVGPPHLEIQIAEVGAPQGLPFVLSSKTPGMKAVKKTSSPTTSTPASQSSGLSDGDSNKDTMGSSSSSKEASLQSNAREVPLQQEVPTSRDRATRNRPLEKSSHGTGITRTQQDANAKASGFETT